MAKIKHASTLSKMQSYSDLQKYLQQSFDEILAAPADFGISEEEREDLNKLKASEDNRAELYRHVVWEVFKANFAENEAGRAMLGNMTPSELAGLIRSDLEEDQVCLHTVGDVETMLKDAGNKKYHLEDFTFKTVKSLSSADRDELIKCLQQDMNLREDSESKMSIIFSRIGDFFGDLWDKFAPIIGFIAEKMVERAISKMAKDYIPGDILEEALASGSLVHGAGVHSKDHSHKLQKAEAGAPEEEDTAYRDLDLGGAGAESGDELNPDLKVVATAALAVTAMGAEAAALPKTAMIEAVVADEGPSPAEVSADDNLDASPEEPGSENVQEIVPAMNLEDAPAAEPEAAPESGLVVFAAASEEVALVPEQDSGASALVAADSLLVIPAESNLGNAEVEQLNQWSAADLLFAGADNSGEIDNAHDILDVSVVGASMVDLPLDM